MLTRLEQVAEILFPKTANVILAHGKARYNPHFDALKQQAKYPTAQGKESASVHCAEWLAQSRKRVFLGQIGVCTVDQVLLSVLPVKHAFVRCFGLGKSVLIVDEVHAYDSYMYGLLAEALQRQREAGGSAILLSATLPYHQRQILARSWGGDVEQVADYPLITQIDADGQRMPSPVSSEHEKPAERTVNLALYSVPDMLPDTALLDEILAAARVGAKVAVICNLVADAQSMARRLQEQATVPVDIFHSRYRFLDRQDKEEEALQHYGKEREAGGRILVATQVVEQSLDLDFDWMVTQLCPMDLLFQRLGRLHRHERQRPNGFGSLRCTVLTAAKDNYGGSEAIYCKAILWRTQQLLNERTHLLFPDVYRPLIEQIYDEAPWENEPQGITEALNEHLGRAMANRHEALRLVRAAINPFDDEDNKVTVLTRAGEMSLNVLLTTGDGESPLDIPQIRLDKQEDWERGETIALHSVPVPASWKKDLPPPNTDYLICLSMREGANGIWLAETTQGQFSYDKEFGLMKQKGME
ncbi:MAG: CRISPR-associated helicase/endonuclease Cas3 [Gammaproteobacteria bacterium]